MEAIKEHINKYWVHYLTIIAVIAISYGLIKTIV